MPHDPPPIPARYRWLKRTGVVALVLLGLLLGLRVVSGIVWHARFEAALQAIRDRGEPIDVEDFQVPLLDDVDNAAYYLRQAMKAWPTVPGTNQSIVETDWYLLGPMIVEPITDNAGYLAACEPALTLIQQAADTPYSHWGYVPTSPVLTTYSAQSYFSEARQLARLMEDASTRAMQLGQPSQAIRINRQIVELSASLLDAPLSVLDQLFAISIRAMAFQLIEEHLVMIDQSSATSTALAQELIMLAAVLGEEEAMGTAHRDALLFERMVFQDTVRAFALGGDPWSSFPPNAKAPSDGTVRRWLLKPLYYRDGCVMLDYLGRYVETSWQTDLAEFEQIEADFAFIGDGGLRMPLAGDLMPALEATQRSRFQDLTRQRLVQTAVAMKRFELEQGRAIASLDELVPDYLDAVPTDPMDPAGGPIRYAPEGGPVLEYEAQWWGSWLTAEQLQEAKGRKLPLLYSVGRDRVDDGGVIGLLDDGTPDESSRTNPINGDGPTDHWFLLAPRPEPFPEPANPSFDPYGGFGGYGDPYGGGYGGNSSP